MTLRHGRKLALAALTGAFLLGGCTQIRDRQGYILDETLPWAPGGASRWWLHGSLESLGRDLKRLGAPLILRLYGQGRVAFRGSPDYRAFLEARYEGEEPLGARQVVFLDIDLVQTSCGFGVPLFEHTGERPTLDRWAAAKGDEGLRAYRQEKNLVSMDGLPTGFVEA